MLDVYCFYFCPKMVRPLGVKAFNVICHVCDSLRATQPSGWYADRISAPRRETCERVEAVASAQIRFWFYALGSRIVCVRVCVYMNKHSMRCQTAATENVWRFGLTDIIFHAHCRTTRSPPAMYVENKITHSACGESAVTYCLGCRARLPYAR